MNHSEIVFVVVAICFLMALVFIVMRNKLKRRNQDGDMDPIVCVVIEGDAASTYVSTTPTKSPAQIEVTKRAQDFRVRAKKATNMNIRDTNGTDAESMPGIDDISVVSGEEFSEVGSVDWRDASPV